MAIDKEITLNVNDQAFQRLQQKAEAMARSMIRNSRQFSTAGREVEQDLGKQIALMEKRNRLNEQAAQSQIAQARQMGQPAPQAAQAAVAEAQESKILVGLVREAIETIRNTSRDEIRADREGVERQIRQSETVGELGPVGDAFDLLRETFQRQDLGLEDQDDGRRNIKDRVVSGLKQADRILAVAAGAQTEFHALAAGIGLISQGAGTLANRLITSADRFERALADRARLTGTTIEIEAGRTGAFEDASYALGMTTGQQAARSAQMQRAFRGRMSDRQAINLMAAETVTGVSGQQINQLLGIGRYDPSATMGASRVDRVLATFERYLRRTDQNIAVLPEILGTYAQISENILGNISNKIDQTQIASSIAAIGTATGQTGVGLQATAGAIQGLAGSQNPVVKSMMMRAFVAQNPGANLFDIQAMMENPLANRQATAGLFQNLRRMTGGGEMYKQALFATFGGSLSRTRINEILEGGGDFTDIAVEAEQFTGVRGRNYLPQAGDFVGTIQQSSARLEAKFEKYGKKAVDFLEDIFKKLDTFFNFNEKKAKDEEEQRRLAAEAYKKYLDEADPKFSKISPRAVGSKTAGEGKRKITYGGYSIDPADYAKGVY